MKIIINPFFKCWWHYNTDEFHYSQEQYDYVFKHLGFDKLYKDCDILFNNKEVGKWFRKTYINDIKLEIIYSNSLLGYQWLKENWGKGILKTLVDYQNKQELKSIVNRVINTKLRIKNNNEI